MEYEERVHTLLREEQLLNDVVPEDYEGWMTSAAGKGQLAQAGELLASVGKSLVSLANRLTHRPEPEPIPGQKRRTMAG